MIAANLSSLGSSVTTTAYSDGTPTTPTRNEFLSHGKYMFSFSGFGSGDKRRKKLPTSGSYDKRRYRLYDGSYYHYNYKLNGSTTWSWMRVEGAADGSATPLFISAPRLSPGYDNNVYNKALSKVYDKIRETELNLAVDIAEGRETVRMVNNALRAMADVIATARRVKRRLLTDPSKLLAELWLSYKYGWLPAYQTVYGLLNYTSRHFDEMTFKGRAKRVANVSINDAITGGLIRTRGSQTYKAEVSITCKVSDTLAFDRARITSLDPVSIAWELVPFSFVVDWFYDVGGYLALQEAALGTGLTFVSGYSTQVYYHKIGEQLSQNYDVALSWPDARHYEVYYQAEEERALKSRQILTGWPRPLAPRLKCDLGSSRIISAASLLRTVLLGKV